MSDLFDLVYLLLDDISYFQAKSSKCSLSKEQKIRLNILQNRLDLISHTLNSFIDEL